MGTDEINPKLDCQFPRGCPEDPRKCSMPYERMPEFCKERYWNLKEEEELR